MPSSLDSHDVARIEWLKVKAPELGSSSKPPADGSEDEAEREAKQNKRAERALLKRKCEEAETRVNEYFEAQKHILISSPRIRPRTWSQPSAVKLA